jgi:hypothetical protein
MDPHVFLSLIAILAVGRAPAQSASENDGDEKIDFGVPKQTTRSAAPPIK